MKAVVLCAAYFMPIVVGHALSFVAAFLGFAAIAIGCTSEWLEDLSCKLLDWWVP